MQLKKEEGPFISQRGEGSRAMILDYYVLHLAIHQDFSLHTVKGYFYIDYLFCNEPWSHTK